ncbi:MAG: sigma-70 family RNA polymerase sigma factor [Planctomycetota bacterium]
MKTAAAEAPRKGRSRRPLALTKALTEAECRLYDRIPPEVGYVDHPSFHKNETEEKLFGEDSRELAVPQWLHFPEVPEDISPPRRKRRALNSADEELLFLRYNYARFRLSKLLRARQEHRTVYRAKEIVLWYQIAMKAKAAITRANMALVLAMAKRTRIPNVEFGELVSEGNMALLRSIEKFDVSRGFKFSTYACRSILKSFNRLATKTGHYRKHFPVEFDPDLERSDYDVHKHDMQRAESIDNVREALAQNRAELTEVERTVVIERFAIGSDRKGKTLSEVGRIVGLTNERVRQIQNLALQKLRSALDGRRRKTLRR